MKVPKQLMQKLKAKKQKTLNNLTYSIFYGFTHLCESCADDNESACEAPEAESGDDEADSCEEETTEETAGAAEETLSAADREVSPQEESEVTAE